MTGLLSLKDFIEVTRAILADLRGDCLTRNKEGLVSRAFHGLEYGVFHSQRSEVDERRMISFQPEGNRGMPV